MKHFLGIFSSCVLQLCLYWMILFPVGNAVAADESHRKEPGNILFFYSDNCADCHAMKQMIDRLIQKDPGLPIQTICIEEEPEAWQEACKNAGIPAWGVPRIFIGEQIFAGWSEKEGDLIYIPGYYGYMGYRNQLLSAMENYLGKILPVVETETAADRAVTSSGCIGGC